VSIIPCFLNILEIYFGSENTHYLLHRPFSFYDQYLNQVFETKNVFITCVDRFYSKFHFQKCI